MKNEGFPLPPNLPVPDDDGAADQFKAAGFRISCVAGDKRPLSSPMGSGQYGHLHVSANRATPDRQPAKVDWDAIPGARGCTPHSCGFRGSMPSLMRWASCVLELGTQTTEFQKEFVERIHFPFPVLSDVALELVRVMRLPTFEYDVAAVGGGGEHAAQADWRGTSRRA